MAHTCDHSGLSVFSKGKLAPTNTCCRCHAQYRACPSCIAAGGVLGEGGVNREEKKWRICITSVIRSDISGLSWTHRKYRDAFSCIRADCNTILITWNSHFCIVCIASQLLEPHIMHSIRSTLIPCKSSSIFKFNPRTSIKLHPRLKQKQGSHFSCQRRNSCSHQCRLKNDPFSEPSKCAAVTWREARVHASESHSQEGIDVGLFLVRQMRI